MSAILTKGSCTWLHCNSPADLLHMSLGSGFILAVVFIIAIYLFAKLFAAGDRRKSGELAKRLTALPC